MRRRIPLAPAEGWLTFGLVLLICLSLAWSVDSARWVGREEYLDYLVLAATGGVLAGFIGPKVGWSRWLTYLIGCIFAALLVPLLTGLVKFPHGAPLHELYKATADATVAAYIDLAILSKTATTQYLHYVMSFGMVVWATSMFASYAVFGHRRALNAVVVVGVLLVLNMASTSRDQLPLLMVFSLASLFLLIRTHVFDEQSEWKRRRIGDPASISSVYLRGGTVFIAVTVAASFVLTQTASSAPLAGAWGGVSDGLINLSRSFSRFLPAGGDGRSLGLDFGPNTQIGGVWSTDSSLELTIQRNPTDVGEYYWRAVTYDQIGFKDWSQSTPTTVVRPAGSPVFDGLADDVVPTGLHSFSFTVYPGSFTKSTIVSPQTPIRVEETVRLSYVGKDGYFATMDRDGGSGPYEVTALVPVPGNDPGQLNEEALRATGTTYPSEITDLYLGVADGSLGPKALQLEAKIVAEAKSGAPVDLANRLVAELRSTAYEYDTDVRDLACTTLSTVECFATFKQGYCQYYAATMAVILRDLDVPTRIAQGFLPGSRQGPAGTESILRSQAHAWVEVYFNDFGWVRFDPTGGSLAGQDGPLPSGRPVASGSARPSTSPGPRASRVDENEGSGGVPGDISPKGPGPLGPLIAVGSLLLLIVAAVAFIAWQRGPRGPTTADGAYGMVTRLASRFGFGPRPTQTVYEFAGSLSVVLPGSRPELETVARAKVESAYGRAILGDERVAELLAAQRRLRLSLLRLLFRRRHRPRRRRR